MSLKILYVIEATSAGAGKHVMDLAGAMLAKGHQVHIAYSPIRMDDAFAAHLATLPFSAHILPMHRSPHPSDLIALVKLWFLYRREGSFDAIHAHSTKAGLLARLAGIFKPPRSKIIYTPHMFASMNPSFAPWLRRIYGWLETWLGNHCTDTIIAVSESEALHAQNTLRIFPSHLCIIHNGMAPIDFTDRHQARKNLGISANDVVVGCIARFMPQKGVDLLIEAATYWQHTPITLLIVGDGPLKQQLENQVERYQLGQQVRFAGYKTAKETMRAMDIFALPSRSESFPYVLLEALQAGLPIVAADVGSVRTIVQDAITGLVVPPEDPASLAQGVLCMLEDAKLYSTMHDACLKQSQRFTLAAMVEATVRVYTQVI